ncbi:MAG: hypothetical protein IPP15_21565 [Saprospiraceae bacterium]|uniref:Uncharacterized protein n=1 Tax=Candidatus Opimibacter skivensis TaxID=2982028 RepID=A0A9D7SXI2_9BACT|nr:hypothetical protein [Candidatus Opimibacter skivensis]
MILLFYIISFLSPFTSILRTDEHPIHASICELKYSEKDAAFQVSVKVYIDDLEVAMKNEGYPPVNLGATTENTLAQEYLASYIDKYFTITQDGHKLTSKFVGKELSDDFLAVWCYLEFPATTSKGQKYTITNRILLDLYSDQRNIMDIRMNSTQKEYTIFDPSNSSWSYTY